MKIIINKESKKYLKKNLEKAGAIYNEESVLKELHNLLDPFDDRFPKNKKIVIRKSDVWNGNNTRRNIYINSRYILDYLTLKNKEFIGKCIVECIGHELGHEKVIFYIALFGLIIKNKFISLASPKDKFIGRLIEVYCDHSSLSFTGFSKDDHYLIMKEHQKRKLNQSKDNKEFTDYNHPTWEERSKYIMIDFNEDLIRLIAQDNGLYKERIIQKQIDYYSKVIKYDGYIDKYVNFMSIAKLSLSIIMIVSITPLIKLLLYIF